MDDVDITAEPVTCTNGNRATGKMEVVSDLRTIAAEEQKVYSRITNHLSRGLPLNRSVRDALDEEMSIPGPAAFAVMPRTLVPGCQGLSPATRPVVVHSTSERLNVADS